MKYKLTLFFVFFQLTGTLVFAQTNTDDIIGVWLTGGDEPAKVQLFKSHDKYYGRIIWLKNPVKDGKPRTDIKNPDESKRGNQVIGLFIINGFLFNGEDEWNGKIYDPESGKTYRAYASLKDKNTLKLRGYVGISLFGRTETWIRVNE